MSGIRGDEGRGGIRTTRSSPPPSRAGWIRATSTALGSAAMSAPLVWATRAAPPASRAGWIRATSTTLGSAATSATLVWATRPGLDPRGRGPRSDHGDESHAWIRGTPPRLDPRGRGHDRIGRRESRLDPGRRGFARIGDDDCAWILGDPGRGGLRFTPALPFNAVPRKTPGLCPPRRTVAARREAPRETASGQNPARGGPLGGPRLGAGKPRGRPRGVAVFSVARARPRWRARPRLSRRGSRACRSRPRRRSRPARGGRARRPRRGRACTPRRPSRRPAA